MKDQSLDICIKTQIEDLQLCRPNIKHYAQALHCWLNLSAKYDEDGKERTDHLVVLVSRQTCGWGPHGLR